MRKVSKSSLKQERNVLKTFVAPARAAPSWSRRVSSRSKKIMSYPFLATAGPHLDQRLSDGHRVNRAVAQVKNTYSTRNGGRVKKLNPFKVSAGARTRGRVVRVNRSGRGLKTLPGLQIVVAHVAEKQVQTT